MHTRLWYTCISGGNSPECLLYLILLTLEIPMIDLAPDNTPAAPANPVGLDLIGTAQQALAAFITTLVQEEVAKAIAAAQLGATAATLMDDNLNDRIRDVAADFLDGGDYATKEWVSNCVDDRLNTHNIEYDHDDFLTEIDTDAVEAALDSLGTTPVDADDDNFADAVRSVIRNHI